MPFYTYVAIKMFYLLLKRIQKVPVQKNYHIYEKETANDPEKVQIFDDLENEAKISRLLHF